MIETVAWLIQLHCLTVKPMNNYDGEDCLRYMVTCVFSKGVTDLETRYKTCERWEKNGRISARDRAICDAEPLCPPIQSPSFVYQKNRH